MDNVAKDSTRQDSAYVERMVTAEESDATHKRIEVFALACPGRICLCETQIVTLSTSAGTGRAHIKQENKEVQSENGTNLGESRNMLHSNVCPPARKLQ